LYIFFSNIVQLTGQLVLREEMSEFTNNLEDIRVY